ncbi:hypothetical protein LAZ67_11002118 [Cordylochernes scorpioides]|uniref:Integrase catalytic domain-containing protein n=1 Tax=Cordylochernes scorpioides TaxID=51811 RepID=A0ABY6L196_9ARAC|nr:hypothetical protein LAZ67_11002118 [Cordylochernes scorpioides]
MYHCGAQTLRSVLREKFWIPKARQLVRHVIHKCPRCRRFETKRVDVPEASLPQHRVRDVVVFEVTGIDLGGPLYLEDGQKVWFVIFTCGVYRAVHLELVTSLSTEALVGAVERFVARRGCPAVIYSDNGTNLVGLRNELYRVNFGVKWKLNPPAAPWWGGWIERIVGLPKKLLRRLLGKRVVNYEEMVTILGNCERVINARPLTYIAEDNDDLVPLTTEMFLREPRAEGEIDLNEFRCNFGKSYAKRKRLLKEFRKRFRSEYLGLLVHHDNRKRQRQLKVGDIVLVEVENRKQINWPMGKITKVFPGTDNVRRLVEVKTKSGFMKRAVQRLFSLEVPSEGVEQGDGELKPAEDEIVMEKTSGVESASVQEKTTPVLASESVWGGLFEGENLPQLCAMSIGSAVALDTRMAPYPPKLVLRHRKRRQFKQTDAFTRGMVIGLKRAGWSIRQIAADTHLGASTVHRLWRRWSEQENVAIYRNVGATRVTSARVDWRILRQAVAAPQATCTAILQHVQDTLDHSISTRTISRRLVANGLHSCRPLRRLPLTPPNRRQRLEWCRARSTWMTEWHRVVFSDESRFCLSSDSRRVRVWRRRGERSNPAAIVERPTVRQRGIMVWGAIAYDSRSHLLRIQGTMTAQRYVDGVLRPVTLPCLQGVPNALYQQDNARPHTARISQQALQDVQMLPWPPYSPDLSPIEHVWDIFGRRLHALPQPRSEDELWQMVEREWRAIPQDAIRTLRVYLFSKQWGSVRGLGKNCIGAKISHGMKRSSTWQICQGYGLGPVLSWWKCAGLVSGGGLEKKDNKGQQFEGMLTDLDLTPLNKRENTYLSKSTGTESAKDITAMNYNIAPTAQWKILRGAISDHRPILTTLNFKIENSWIFPVGLEDHAITISSAAKYAIYVFIVDRKMRGVAGDPLAKLHQTLQRWQRRHIHCAKLHFGQGPLHCTNCAGPGALVLSMGNKDMPEDAQIPSGSGRMTNNTSLDISNNSSAAPTNGPEKSPMEAGTLRTAKVDTTRKDRQGAHLSSSGYPEREDRKDRSSPPDIRLNRIINMKIPVDPYLLIDPSSEAKTGSIVEDSGAEMDTTKAGYLKTLNEMNEFLNQALTPQKKGTEFKELAEAFQDSLDIIRLGRKIGNVHSNIFEQCFDKLLKKHRSALEELELLRYGIEKGVAAALLENSEMAKKKRKKKKRVKKPSEKEEESKTEVTAGSKEDPPRATPTEEVKEPPPPKNIRAKEVKDPPKAAKTTKPEPPKLSGVSMRAPELHWVDTASSEVMSSQTGSLRQEDQGGTSRTYEESRNSVKGRKEDRRRARSTMLRNHSKLLEKAHDVAAELCLSFTGHVRCDPFPPLEPSTSPGTVVEEVSAPINRTAQESKRFVDGIETANIDGLKVLPNPTFRPRCGDKHNANFIMCKHMRDSQDQFNKLMVLGVRFDQRLSFHQHVVEVCAKISGMLPRLTAAANLNFGFGYRALRTLYLQVVVPAIAYASAITTLPPDPPLHPGSPSLPGDDPLATHPQAPPTSKDIDKRKMKLEDIAAPFFKGLPKIHKEGVPLRSIVSGFKAPTRRLADWLKKQLKLKSGYVKRLKFKKLKVEKEEVERIKFKKLKFE